MTIEQFRSEFKGKNSIYYEDYIIFKVRKNRWELYKVSTDETQVFATLEQLAENEKAKEIIEKYEHTPMLFKSGRKDRSNSKPIFGSGIEIKKRGKLSKKDFPSRVNVNKAEGSTTEGTLKEFVQRHGADKKESGYTIDDEGYVTTYRHGAKNYVAWEPQDLEGKFVAHNHPSGSNFSGEDLLTTASTNARGILAGHKTGNSGYGYVFEKTAKFDSVGFQKALANAKSKKGNYDEALDSWLKHNAKRFGYTYKKETYTF